MNPEFYSNDDLVDCLLQISHITDRGIHFVDNQGDAEFVSYHKLWLEVHQTANGLLHQSVGKNDSVVFLLSNNKNLVVSFWACQLIGAVPSIIECGTIRQSMPNLHSIIEQLDSPILLTDESVGNSQNNLHLTKKLKQVILFKQLKCTQPKCIKPKANRLAYVHFSCATAELTRGVIKTQHNLLTNCYKVIETLSVDGNDRTYSCMPLTNEMGLVGFHITPLIAGIDQFILSSGHCLSKPKLWTKN